MHRLEEGLPAVPQQQGPVKALRVLQPHLLPARVSVLAERHAPPLRMASAERVHVDEEHGVHTAVAHLADLHGQADDHVQVVHAVLVALERQRHPLAPPRVEEGLQAHLVADEGGVDVQTRVHLLQQVLELQVLEVQVRLEADELLAALRVHVLRFAAAAVQLVALVAGAALGDVGQAAHGATVVAADHARDGPLAKGGPRVAHACALALQEGSPEAVLVAVEERLHAVQPL